MKSDTTKNDFLDIELIKQFRQEINKDNNVFINDIDLKEKYDLICVFLDRMTTAVEYLNNQNIPFEAETDFTNFMVYACIVFDGINKLSENFFQKRPDLIERKELSKSANVYGKPFFNEDNCPTDYKFFEFLRALTFAHPYEVDNRQRKFMDNNEIYRSPWVICRSHFDDKYNVGVRIYSNKQGKLIDLTVPFDELKAFIVEVYSNLSNYTKWAEDEITHRESKWKEQKVNRNQDSILILKDISNILKNRFVETYSIDLAISYLTCNVTNVKNENSINLFRKAIISKISVICDCVEVLDYESMEDALSILSDTPRKMHDSAHYELEKIYTYLDEKSEKVDLYSNEAWGLIQAKNFAAGFAKKWVTIDVDNMDYSEIKLLVATACYLEKEAQEKGEVLQ